MAMEIDCNQPHALVFSEIRKILNDPIVLDDSLEEPECSGYAAITTTSNHHGLVSPGLSQTTSPRNDLADGVKSVSAAAAADDEFGLFEQDGTQNANHSVSPCPATPHQPYIPCIDLVESPEAEEELHQPHPPQEDPQPFVCQNCGQILETERRFRQHRAFCNASYHCEVCGVMCRTKTAFQNHARTHKAGGDKRRGRPLGGYTPSMIKKKSVVRVSLPAPSSIEMYTSKNQDHFDYTRPVQDAPWTFVASSQAPEVGRRIAVSQTSIGTTSGLSFPVRFVAPPAQTSSAPQLLYSSGGLTLSVPQRPAAGQQLVAGQLVNLSGVTIRIVTPSVVMAQRPKAIFLSPAAVAAANKDGPTPQKNATVQSQLEMGEIAANETVSETVDEGIPAEMLLEMGRSNDGGPGYAVIGGHRRVSSGPGSSRAAYFHGSTANGGFVGTASGVYGYDRYTGQPIADAGFLTQPISADRRSAFASQPFVLQGPAVTIVPIARLPVLHRQPPKIRPGPKPKRTNTWSTKHGSGSTLSYLVHQCPRCRGQFASRHALLAHMTGKHKMVLPNPGFFCARCCGRYPARQALQGHLKRCGEPSSTPNRSAPARMNFGSNAPEKARTRSQADYSDRREGAGSARRRGPARCDWCKYFFSSPDALRYHHEIQGCSARPLACDQCQLSFKSAQLLREHLAAGLCSLVESTRLQLVKNSSQNAEPQPSPICQLCQEVFASKPLLQEHTSTVHPGSEFRCAACPFESLEKTSLTEHLLLSHSGFNRSHPELLPHLCNFCDSGFLTPEAYETHLKRHSGANLKKRVVCKLCGAPFASKAQGSLHYSIVHTFNDAAGKHYKCAYCLLSFGFAAGLIAHLSFHRAETSNGSREKSERKNGSRQISGKIMPFECCVCGAGFRWRTELIKHAKEQQESHANKPCICCTKCGDLLPVDDLQKHGMKYESFS